MVRLAKLLPKLFGQTRSEPPPASTPSSDGSQSPGVEPQAPLSSDAVQGLTSDDPNDYKARLILAEREHRARQLKPGMLLELFHRPRLAGEKSPEESQAYERYMSPDFAWLPEEEKRATLTALKRFVLPGAMPYLEAFHLPQRFSADSSPKVVTFALEAEADLMLRDEILEHFAPDAKGRLDPRALTDEVLELLEPAAGRGEAWTRLDSESRRKSLNWKDLGSASRVLYLHSYAEHVDSKVPMVLLEGADWPPSLGKLVWEGSAPLVSEVVTDGHYESRDQLWQDAETVFALNDLVAPGFHVHQVVELSTPEDLKRLGPKLVALAALQDLQLFAHGFMSCQDSHEQTHLEPFTAEGLKEAAESFAGGELQADLLEIHKFHSTGIRVKIYGQGIKIGIEIRGVPIGLFSSLMHVNERLSALLLSGRFQELPSPPWGGYDAGQPELPGRAFEDAKADPDNADLAEAAQTSFEDIFGLVTSPRDVYKLASPLWKLEALPGATEEDRTRIAQARKDFMRSMLELSVSVTEAMEPGVELDRDAIKERVVQNVRRFFVAADVDQVINRLLNGLLEPKP